MAIVSTPEPVSVGPDTGSGATTPVTFTSFNSSLGTLQEVIYTYNNITATGQDQITNNAGSSKSFTVFLNGAYDIVDSKSNDVQITLTTTPDTQTIASGAEHTFNASSTGVNPPSQTLIGTAGGGTVDLSGYLGNGTSTVNVSLVSNSYWTVSTTAGFSAVPSSFATGNISVEYIYSAVPEPRQTVALMLGFGICILLGRTYLKKQGSDGAPLTLA